jgi:hypothetical protein
MERIKISYVGDKPTISPNGIYFNASKPDKYVYLQAVSHIISTLLDMGQTDDKFIEYFDLSKKFSDEQILDFLYKLNPDFNSFYESNIDQYERKIKSEEEEVDLNQGLSEIEKEILENNYHLMFDYRIQRAKNKLAYEGMINGAVKLIEERKITLIKALFTREFFHALQSLKTTIEMKKNPPKTSLKFVDSSDSAKDIELELKIEYFKPLS